MPFHVFDAFTGDDVATFPEQVLGKRWSESSLSERLRHILFVVALGVAGVGVFLLFSLT